MNQQIILARGIPGSGKTTFAKKLVTDEDGMVHVEADMWFETTEGYKFDPYRLTSAHTWCVTHTEGEIRRGMDVVVSNTFTLAAECAPYFVLAEKYGCILTIIECAGDFKSVHGIPEDKLEIMKARWISKDDILKTFRDKDLSWFYNNPYDAYQFFSTYGKVCANE